MDYFRSIRKYIYANLTVTTLLNFNHLWITQAELCLNGTFIKASFVFVTIFSGIYENISSPVPNIQKIINWNKNWHRFLFPYVFVVPQKGIWRLEGLHKAFFRHQTEVYITKIYVNILPYLGLRWQGLSLSFLLNSKLIPFPFP